MATLGELPLLSVALGAAQTPPAAVLETHGAVVVIQALELAAVKVETPVEC